MPQNAFLPRTCDLLISRKTMQRHFFPPSIHPLSPVIFAAATVLSFVLLRSSRFSFHCYTQREATPTQKSARKWRCDLSRLAARKITKGIHSCKPASLNRPISTRQSALHTRSQCQQSPQTPVVVHVTLDHSRAIAAMLCAKHTDINIHYRTSMYIKYSCIQTCSVLTMQILT